MSLSLQIVLSGLAAGSVYGLLAVGYVLVYRLTGIVHFALGDLVGLGVFVALFVTAGQGTVTEATASSWRFVLGLLVALAVVPALTAATWFGVIQPQVGRGLDAGLGGGHGGDRFRDPELRRPSSSPARRTSSQTPSRSTTRAATGSSPSPARRSSCGRST